MSIYTLVLSIRIVVDSFYHSLLSKTIILVQWGDVPAADQNGIIRIRSYTVIYRVELQKM